MGTATTAHESDAPTLTVTSLRIERDVLAEFKQLAKANQRTVSQELRYRIHQALKEEAA